MSSTGHLTTAESGLPAPCTGIEDACQRSFNACTHANKRLKPSSCPCSSSAQNGPGRLSSAAEAGTSRHAANPIDQPGKPTMKKSLIALAVLGAVAGAASAQTNVT
ncbi:hypothetical protein RY831_16130, partial [Noviherbaspirillum sp. CPCC 100848]